MVENGDLKTDLKLSSVQSADRKKIQLVAESCEEDNNTKSTTEFLRREHG